MTATRNETIRSIRKLVRGVGAVKGVWRLSIDELRGHAGRILANKADWLTPRELRMLEEFTPKGE